MSSQVGISPGIPTNEEIWEHLTLDMNFSESRSVWFWVSV